MGLLVGTKLLEEHGGLQVARLASRGREVRIQTAMLDDLAPDGGREVLPSRAGEPQLGGDLPNVRASLLLANPIELDCDLVEPFLVGLLGEKPIAERSESLAGEGSLEQMPG